MRSNTADPTPALDVLATASQPPSYTVAIFEGELPTSTPVLITCTHPRVIMEAADLCLEQARIESLGLPDVDRREALTMLEQVRDAQRRTLAHLRRAGVVV